MATVQRSHQTHSDDGCSSQRIDYDLHGLVGLRLVNASAQDAAAVARQLGPMQKPLDREPDVVVRFVPQLPTPHLRYLGKDKGGFTDQGYFVLRHNKQRVKVRIPFEQIGNRCEILCESGAYSVPLLMHILNLTLLRKDCVPVHASAFIHRGTGVVVTGWADGGKTTALLAFCSQGADYVGDEWIWLRGDGQAMYGLPRNLNLSSWHLEELPQIRHQVAVRKRLFFQCVHGFDHLQDKLLAGMPDTNLAVKLPRKMLGVLKRQVEVRVEPATLFSSHAMRLVARPGKVFLFTSQQGPDLHCEPVSLQQMVRRMALAVQYEQLAFLEHYLAFRFAFPDCRNDYIENAHQLQQDILGRALMGKEKYMVRHPYPVPVRPLFDVMRPFIEHGGMVAGASGRELCGDALALSDAQQRSVNA